MNKHHQSINQWTHDWALKNKLNSVFKKELTSTNAEAKLSKDTSFQLFLADQQSQGRGRGQNRWDQNTPGHCLLSTWCFTATSPQPVFAARVGLALYQALLVTWPQGNFSLKAPNDVYLNDGKLAGLLIELSQIESQRCRFYIGLGLNVFSSPTINDQKTSSLKETKTLELVDWELFCQNLYNSLVKIQNSSERNQLTSQECQDLVTALNRHPIYKYKDIRPDGSLQNQDGQWQHWTDL